MKSKNIPAIYNYCDSWCERCAFTNRCLNFQRGQEEELKFPITDDDSVLASVSRNLNDALSFLKKAASEQGCDLDSWSMEENEAWEKKRREIDEALKAHELSKLTREYSNKTLDLLERRPHFKEMMLSLVNQIKAGMKTAEDTIDEVQIIPDHLEVVKYYVHFIHVKFQRALRGLIEDDGWEEKHGYQRDCDGSAKIALISTDKCIEAWIKINELMPGNEDEIVDLLALLQKIKRIGEDEFPKARSFIRPGFDDHLVDKKKKWFNW
jgi:hypothetical protein